MQEAPRSVPFGGDLRKYCRAGSQLMSLHRIEELGLHRHHGGLP